MSNVINLDEVLTTKQDLSYKGETYTFRFSDKTQQALREAWVKANALVKQLVDDDKKKDNSIDKKPVDEQLEFVRNTIRQERDIIMAFFEDTIGKDKAERLYHDLNESTDGLLFVLGLVKRASDKALKDAEDQEYPAFDGNKDND
jgi:hypothetical protein